MPDTNDPAFQQATQGTVPQRDVNVRQISNGFVLQGVTRYVDPNTKQAKVAVADEAIGADAKDAADKASQFLNTGAFE